MSNKVSQTNNMYVPNGKRTFARDHLEPITIQKVTKRTIEILVTDYKKANLPEIIKETCRHLSSLQ